MLLIFKMMSSFVEYIAIYNVLDEVIISFLVAFVKPLSEEMSSQGTHECWDTFHFSDHCSATSKEHLVTNPSL